MAEVPQPKCRVCGHEPLPRIDCDGCDSINLRYKDGPDLKVHVWYSEGYPDSHDYRDFHACSVQCFPAVVAKAVRWLGDHGYGEEDDDGNLRVDICCTPSELAQLLGRDSAGGCPPPPGPSSHWKVTQS